MVFPVGVEQMTMSFEHSFFPASNDALTSHLVGGSNSPPGEPGSVTSRLRGFDGALLETVESGSAISRSVDEWLAMAGISLNAPNTNLTADYNDQNDPNLSEEQWRYPTFRTSGVLVDVSIEYDNRCAAGPSAPRAKPICAANSTACTARTATDSTVGSYGVGAAGRGRQTGRNTCLRHALGGPPRKAPRR